MRANEFEINKFSGVVNSIVNPDPKTSAICTNFDIFSIEGALQTRRGIKKFLDFNFANLPFPPFSREIIGFTIFYSEKYNRDFFIVAVNENYNYSYRLGDNINICNFYVYPSLLKINDNYQVINAWTSINQFAIGVVENFQYDTEYFTRNVFVDLGEINDRIDNSFLYWTGIVVDKNSNKVKNTFYVSGEHKYDDMTSLVKFNLDNDYNIREQDKIIFVKNYVKIKSNYLGVEDYFGLIPPIENIKFYQNDTGINIISSNLPVLKICLDFNKLISVNEVINCTSYVLDNNFNNFNIYWERFGSNVNNYTIEDKNVVSIGYNSGIISYPFTISVQNRLPIKIEIEFQILNEGNNYLTGSILHFDGNNWTIYDDLGIITQSAFLTNSKNKWYRVSIYKTISDNGEYRLELRNSGATGNRVFVISDVKAYPLNIKTNLLTFNNHIQDFYLQNEPFGNNGFYIQSLIPDLVSIEDVESQIKNNNPIYVDYILSKTYSSSNIIMADRIIASLNSVNELCVYQQRRRINPDTFNNRNFVINYKLLNRRINEFTAFFSQYTSNVLVDYYLMPFYKIQGDITLLQEVLLDGRINAFYNFDNNVKVINLTDYLGFEAGEELIKKWNIQENNYIAQVETKNGQNQYQIYYSAINGNGAFMNDIYPIGNVIQIPVEGGIIKGLSISKIRNMFILKSKAVYLLDLDTNSLIKLSYSDGIIGDKAYISDGYSVYWLDVNGIKVSDGTQIINLTKNLNNLDYLSLTNKERAIVYLNSDLKSLEFCIDNQIFSYPIEGIIYNFKKTTSFNIKDVKQNYLGDIYYLSDRIYKQTTIADKLYSDENYLPPLIYETNEFDIVNLGEQFPNDTRISINEIFIEYESKSDFDFILIGDGIVVASYKLRSSTNKRLERFQIAGIEREKFV